LQHTLDSSYIHTWWVTKGERDGILDEVASMASMILSIVRYGWKNLDYLGKPVDKEKDCMVGL